MLKKLIMASIAILSASNAQAAIVTYDNFADFSAAAGSTVLEDFNRPAIVGSFQIMPIDVGDFTVSRKTQTAPFNNIGLNPATQDVDRSINVGFFSTPHTSVFLTFDRKITAFGANFKAFNNLDQSRVVVNGIDLRPVNNGRGLSYFGLVSDTPFDLVELRTLVGPNGEGETAGFDNARYAFAAAVPEPASWALMIIGFGLVGGTMRKRGGVHSTMRARAGAA